jgi:hypothetical protein
VVSQPAAAGDGAIMNPCAALMPIGPVSSCPEELSRVDGATTFDHVMKVPTFTTLNWLSLGFPLR